jgi:hypothetical protein
VLHEFLANGLTQKSIFFTVQMTAHLWRLSRRLRSSDVPE